MTGVEFLQFIYENNVSDGDWVVLAIKGESGFFPKPIRYNSRTFSQNVRKLYDQFPPNKYDYYFSPMGYTQRRRQNEFGKTSKMLFQDIDKCEDVSKLKIPPNFAWETSEGNWQGVWFLKREVNVQEYSALNRSLCKYLGCDLGAYDFAHVYRIPKTYNLKPGKNSWQVKEPIEISKSLHSVERLKKRLPKSLVTVNMESTQPDEPLPDREIFARYNLPVEVRQRLAADPFQLQSEQRRSSHIFELIHDLAKIGLTSHEIYSLIANSPFNKFKGRKEPAKEIYKIISKAHMRYPHSIDVDERGELIKRLGENRFDILMGKNIPDPEWLINGLWMKGSSGFIAGVPKAFKSTLAMDLAICVADRNIKTFLGRKVNHHGTVLMFQAEDSQRTLISRMRKVYQFHRPNAKPKDWGQLKLHVLTDPTISLNEEAWKTDVEEAIKQYKPLVVIFDPLYHIVNVDLTSLKEVTPLLKWLTNLRTQYLDMSIIIVHHYNKATGSMAEGKLQSLNPGAGMFGSVGFQGWYENAWFIYKTGESFEGEDDDTTIADISIKKSFREGSSGNDLELMVRLGKDGYSTRVAGLEVENGNEGVHNKRP
jgi:hypothetical protein